MNDKRELPESCEIMGHQIYSTYITNPHIQRAIMRQGGFLFGYDDYKDAWGDYNDMELVGGQGIGG